MSRLTKGRRQGLEAIEDGNDLAAAFGQRIDDAAREGRDRVAFDQPAPQQAVEPLRQHFRCDIGQAGHQFAMPPGAGREMPQHQCVPAMTEEGQPILDRAQVRPARHGRLRAG